MDHLYPIVLLLFRQNLYKRYKSTNDICTDKCLNKDLFHFYIRCRHWLSFCFLAFPMNEKKHFTYFLKKIKFQQGKMTANGHFAVKIWSLDTYFWSTNTTIAEMTAPANTIPPKTPTISPDRGKRHYENMFIWTLE